MDISDFQYQIRRFRMDSADYEYAAMNLAAEVGELLSLLAKERRDGTPADDKAIEKEFGDCLHMLCMLADDCEIDLDAAAHCNVLKLEGRLKRGTITGSGDER